MLTKIKINVVLFVIFLITFSCRNKPEPPTIVNPKSVTIAKDNPIDYLQIGKSLALDTKSNLAKHLINALSEKDSDGAVAFCNIHAIPITDSISVVQGAKIKRVSDQPRNPKNLANKAELAYIKAWQEAKAKGVNHQPLISEINGKMVGYYPITTNKMCMQCHGKLDKDINVATQKKIKILYPADLATGYSEDEIRGIFVVEMDK